MLISHQTFENLVHIILQKQQFGNLYRKENSDFVMNFFKKKDKKPTVNNGDINKTLLDEEVGIGIQPKPTANPLASNSGDVSKPKQSRKKEIKEGYDWDFCIVIPNPEDEGFRAEPTTEEYLPPIEILERLHSANLQTYQYLSGDADEIFIKIRAPLDVLRSHAENMEFKMLLDSNYIKKHIENLKEPIGQDPNHTTLSPYEFIYASYNDCKAACCKISELYFCTVGLWVLLFLSTSHPISSLSCMPILTIHHFMSCYI